MRRPTFYRKMNIREEQYAWDLFRGTLPPGNQIGIGDGLGLGDRPWTDTGSDPDVGMPFMAFQVNLGDMASMDLTSTAYFGGFGRICDTFIHELTHVWQYYHGDFVKTSSVAAQAWEFLTTDLVITKQGIRREVTNDAYEYRPLDRSNSWDDYNSEQQAHIVEDWNYSRDKNNELYPFISEVIQGHGDPKFRGQSLDELRSHLYFPPANNAPPPPKTITPDSLDGVLIPILEKRYGPNDIAGFGGRVRKLEQMFRDVDQLQAMSLLGRLTVRKNGDPVSMYFYDRLSAATRINLLAILRKSSVGVMV